MTGSPGDPGPHRPTATPAADGSLPSYPPSAGRPPGTPENVAAWRRLHPLSPLVRSGRHLTSFAILLLLLIFANTRQAGRDFIQDLVVVAIVLVGGVISWAVTRWRVAGGVLLIDSGLIRRQSRRFPLSQVQAIDVVQTGFARVLGLAEIRLRMAGADSSGGRLVALRLSEAQALRAELLSLTAAAPGSAAPAHKSPVVPATPEASQVPSPSGASQIPRPLGASRVSQTSGTPQGAPQVPETSGAAATSSAPSATGASAAPAVPVDTQPERLVFRVHPGRLVVGLALSVTGAIVAVVIAAVALLASLTNQPGVAATYLPVAVGVVIGVWRQFNGEYGTTVAVAPDGLRLRSGLVQTTAETIRPGRVQAVRLVEPLVWRAFGWCRLEVDVAGPRQRRENRSEGRRLRPLVPVGTRADAERMLSEVVSAPPAPSERPPRHARWKAPLMYHFLAWGGNDRYVVAARGRLRRATTWIPLEKVQSVRWMQGPVQRRLGLASVRLDVAGRRVTAGIQDRSVAEAGELLRRLPALARAARARAAPASRPLRHR